MAYVTLKKDLKDLMISLRSISDCNADELARVTSTLEGDDYSQDYYHVFACDKLDESGRRSQ